MRSLLPAFFAALAFSSTSSLAAPAQCLLHLVVPQDGRISIGKTTVSLGDADSKDQPTSWEGPLKAGRCTFDPGVIEQPIAVTPRGWLYVSSYSGSARMVTLYDLESCSVRWQSPSFDGKLELDSHELRLGETRMTLDNACVPQASAFRNSAAGNMRPASR